jgi:electron transport complex protein RnfB
MPNGDKKISRRQLFGKGLFSAMLGGTGVFGGYLSVKGRKNYTLWQIDSAKCTQCGNCATYCVLEESAVKCVHTYALCGYCDLCTGYLDPLAKDINTGAENELCPTGAIKRSFIQDPYYEYSIDEKLCIGCAKCVKGCTAFGNGSLFMQVRHDRCVNCNECAIAAACPSEAFVRVDADQPYLLKGDQPE